jgi:Protein of unknown function (DUF2924)
VDTAVLIEVENLRRANVASLLEKYRRVFGEETRSRHREHLFRKIAWRLQARAEGGLSERAIKRAQDIADDADLRKVAPKNFFTLGHQQIETTPGERSHVNHDRRMPMPGTLLKRTWNSRTILVEVLAKGFRYEGRPYSSLSAIAVKVTGTRWNGLAFFGLTPNVSKPRKEQPLGEQ